MKNPTVSTFDPDLSTTSIVTGNVNIGLECLAQ